MNEESEYIPGELPEDVEQDLQQEMREMREQFIDEGNEDETNGNS